MDWMQQGLSLLSAALNKLPNRPALILTNSQKRSVLSDQLVAVAEEISLGTASRIRFRTDGDGRVPDRPALSIVGAGGHRVQYLAAPKGPEAAPFLDALTGMALGKSGLDASLRERLAEVRSPAELFVFVSASCPHCPAAARLANSFAVESPHVQTAIIDVQWFDDLATRYNVRNVPLILIDGELAFFDIPSADALIEVLLERGTNAYAARVVTSLVETQRIPDIVQKMKAGEFAPWLSVWITSTLHVRMGLMLAAEQALEQDPTCLDSMVPALLGALESMDASARGDTADLLGRIGLRSAADALRRLQKDPNPDVAEIASEALAALHR